MQEIYLKDCYQKEFETEVLEVKNDKFIVLKETLFYPNAGGQLNDTGTLEKDGEVYNVVYVGKFSGNISHEVDKPGLKPGDSVKGKLNWDFPVEQSTKIPNGLENYSHKTKNTAD